MNNRKYVDLMKLEEYLSAVVLKQACLPKGKNLEQCNKVLVRVRRELGSEGR
jgi:hypothetical protein